MTVNETKHLFISIHCLKFSSLCPFVDFANLSAELLPVLSALLAHEGADPWSVCHTYILSLMFQLFHVSFDIQNF